jgi:hypothetical protein
MLNKLLVNPTSREKTLYAIGLFLGLFPKDSFDEFKYLFDENQENEIQKFLSSILNQLQRQGAIFSDKSDNVRWNEHFQVSTYLQSIEKKKVDKVRLSQERANAKKILRKFISSGQIIDDSGLKLQVTTIDIETLLFKTTVLKNTKWDHVFSVGFLATWDFNSFFDGVGDDDMVIFEAQPEFEESAKSAQSLLYLYSNGEISIERDS